MRNPFLRLALTSGVLCVLTMAYPYLSDLTDMRHVLPAATATLSVTVCAPGDTECLNPPPQTSGGGTGGGTSGGSSGGGGGGGGGLAINTPIIPKLPSSTAIKGDFNGDGKVNISDFSILAYWYKRPLTDAAAKYDLNSDGKINLVDFSILAYYWTK